MALIIELSGGGWAALPFALLAGICFWAMRKHMISKRYYTEHMDE